MLKCATALYAFCHSETHLIGSQSPDHSIVLPVTCHPIDSRCVFFLGGSCKVTQGLSLRLCCLNSCMVWCIFSPVC